MFITRSYLIDAPCEPSDGFVPIWDRLFGTYRDAETFASACGFPRNNERKLGRMLMFRDVYND